MNKIFSWSFAKSRIVTGCVLAGLAFSSCGAIIIEKKWAPFYSADDMRRIAKKRALFAARLMGPSELSEAVNEIPWHEKSPDAWAPAVTDWVNEALDSYPPQKGHDKIRIALFEVMDVVVHLEFTPPIVEALDRMYHHRVDPAIEEIASLPGVDHARIWKIYNMGFVVMTKNHCLAFDVHPGKVVTPLSDAQIEALADRYDAFFISHRHGDHWDEKVLDAFAKRGKPVIVPEGDFWQGPGLIVVRDTKDSPLELDGIRAWAYPGHQFGSALCNLYVVEADGFTISHNGDMSAPYPWALTMEKRHDIDVQLLNCWALPSFNALGQTADMIIIGHEWELGHDINGRRGYDETQAMLGKRFARTALTWGEHVDYIPEIK